MNTISQIFCVLARRTTPLLEYIKNRKLEKQVRSDFCLKFNIYVSHGFPLDNLQLSILNSSENSRRETRGTKAERTGEETSAGGGEKEAQGRGKT